MLDRPAPITKKGLDNLAFQIVKLLEPCFNALEKRTDAFDAKLDQLVSKFDAFLKRLNNIKAVNHARDAQLDRPERWTEKAAKQTGVKLEY